MVEDGGNMQTWPLGLLAQTRMAASLWTEWPKGVQFHWIKDLHSGLQGEVDFGVV